MAGGQGSGGREVAGSAELQAQLRLQDEAAQAMRARRVADGALEFCRDRGGPAGGGWPDQGDP